jgi:hypothetical protein
VLLVRVVDPYSFFPDPDPEVDVGDQYGSKTAIYLSLGLHKVCPSNRRSLQLSKEAIQHFKT